MQKLLLEVSEDGTKRNPSQLSPVLSRLYAFLSLKMTLLLRFHTSEYQRKSTQRKMEVSYWVGLQLAWREGKMERGSKGERGRERGEE